MKRQFREDLICERLQSIDKIRDRLSNALHKYRKITTCINNMHKLIEINTEIEILRWVLQQELTLEDFYKKRYGKDIPQEVM